MTDFLNCPLPLYEPLRGEHTRMLNDKRASRAAQDRARGVHAVIDDLNAVVPAYRAAVRDLGEANAAASELRAMLQQRQQQVAQAQLEARQSDNFKAAYHTLRGEYDALEATIEAEVAKRVSAAVSEHTKERNEWRVRIQSLAQTSIDNSAEIARLENELAAASRENHFIDARAYGGAMLIGAVASAVVALLVALPFIN